MGSPQSGGTYGPGGQKRKAQTDVILQTADKGLDFWRSHSSGSGGDSLPGPVLPHQLPGGGGIHHQRLKQDVPGDDRPDGQYEDALLAHGGGRHRGEEPGDLPGGAGQRGEG